MAHFLDQLQDSDLRGGGGPLVVEGRSWASLQ